MTLSRDLAKTAQISQTNPTLGDTLYQGVMKATQDAASPHYAPYNKPTNRMAIDELTKLGVDTNKMDKDF